MTRMQNLERTVINLYAAHNPKRADWADWLAENHVLLVADNAADLARRYGASEELARASALLHDIADTRMSRFAPEHEETSLAMARELMQQAGFNQDEIRLSVDDAIRFHSCHDGHIPESTEGKVLASADSKAHLLSDFYIFATWSFGGEGKTLEEAKQYVLKKIERDFHDKIQFDEVQQECQEAYDNLRILFDR